MQLARFKAYHLNLVSLKSELRLEDILLFRLTESKWFNKDDDLYSGEHLAFLEKALELDEPLRPSTSLHTYIPIPEFEAVVITRSKKSPRKTTIDKFKHKFRECLQHSNHEFDASHCTLTGLLNSASLDQELRRALSTPPAATREGATAMVSDAPADRVCVLYLDIDYFKQVNDSYGHAYGNLVLITFAQRVQKLLSEFQVANKRIKLHLARPGGEEFTVIACGPLTDKIIRDLAEKIRLGVQSDIMPTEQEWEAIKRQKLARDVALPHTSERKITTSVGISSIVSCADVQNPEGIGDQLKKEADAGVYRAKAGGRDTCRYFPDIREKNGRVLEHHTETGVVILDIGTQVGVEPGHEFLVMHPDFTGHKNYIFSDGRSKKVLGRYPKLSSGRIVVFDSQADISFCSVEKNDTGKSFPIGSILEFIPLGSISHLISQNTPIHGLSALRLGKVDDLTGALKDTDDSVFPSSFVFSILDASRLVEKHGSAFVNRSLLSLFQAVEKVFPAPDIIASIGTTMIAALTFRQEIADPLELIKSVLDNAETKVNHVVNFGGGASIGSQLFTPKSKLFKNYSVEYARYAASHLILNKETPIHLFDVSTPDIILQAQRRLNAYDQAIKDYINLRRMGASTAYFENTAALCMVEGPNPDLAGALLAIRSARELEPSNPTFKTNHAVIEYGNGAILAAFDLFEDYDDLENDVYLPYFASASYEKFLGDPSSIEAASLLDRITRALTIKPIASIPLIHNLSDLESKLQHELNDTDSAEASSE